MEVEPDDVLTKKDIKKIEKDTKKQEKKQKKKQRKGDPDLQDSFFLYLLTQE